MATDLFSFSRVEALKVSSIAVGAVLVITGVATQVSLDIIGFTDSSDLGFIGIAMIMMLGLLLVMYGAALAMGFLEGRPQMYWVGVALYVLLVALGLMGFYGFVLTFIGAIAVVLMLVCDQLRTYFKVGV